MDEMIYTAAPPKIGPEEVRQAARTLQKYRQGKAQLEQRLIENEQFWKLRHWQEMEKKGAGGNGADPRPTRAVGDARPYKPPQAARPRPATRAPPPHKQPPAAYSRRFT